MSKVLLFGAGGVGSVYAYVLLQGGSTVSAVCRSNYEAVKENGFTINSAVWGQGIHIKPAVVRTPQEAKDEEWDYVVLSSKAMPGANPSIPDIIKPVIGPRTAIVLCQNGIHIEEEYAKAFPNNPIISGVIYLPTTQITPGVITHGNLETLEVGTYPSNAPQWHKDSVAKFAETFRAGGGTIEVFDDVQVRRWKKLIVNGTWNPLCALSRGTDVQLLVLSAEAENTIWNMMLEIIKIAQACGYTQITEKDAEISMERVKGRISAKGIYPSMVADAVHMRPMEVEAIVGNTVKLAREKGVSVPRMDLIYMLISGLDESNKMKREQK